MRMQNVREGQQWQSRLGITCTILEIFDELDPVMVFAEMGGTLVKFTLKEFNSQFHKLTKESHLASSEPTPKVYNHGDVWLGEDGNNYMIIRGLRKRGNGVVLYEYGRDSNLIDNKSTLDVKLIQMISYSKPHSLVDESVMYRGKCGFIDSIELNNATIHLPGEDPKTLGFRFLVYKNQYLTPKELSELAKALETPRSELSYVELDNIITRIESDVIRDRWGDSL